jgi:uncharacterized protein
MTLMRAISAACVALALTWAAGLQAAAPSRYDPPREYDGVAKSSLYIQSGDGTRLAITVWRPAGNGTPVPHKLPVIVLQTRNESANIPYFVEHGYVVVGQDRRGTGASFGRQTGFINPRDVQDAVAVIEWAGSQAFSNGKVVAMGCSNQGAWQYVTAARKPKYLLAIAPACSSPQFFDDAVTINGVPMFESREKPYGGECTPPRAAPAGAPSIAPVDTDTDGSQLRAAREEQKCNAPMLGQYYRHMPRDGMNSHDSYRPGIDDSAITYAREIKSSGVAILQIGGWFDAAGIGQLASQAYWGGRVIMGPWVHGNGIPRGAEFPNGRLDLDAEVLRWFDHHAKGARNGAGQPGILYYTLNAPAGQEWKSTDRWPWRGQRLQNLFFGSTGLVAKAPDLEPVSYAGRDVPIWEGRFQPLNRWSDEDMSPSDHQSLSQTGEAFATDTELTGTPMARLWISADSRDVNLYAFLEDVAPDGKSTRVTDGRIRASWRTTHAAAWGVKEQLWHRGYADDLVALAPGETVELAFDLLPVSYVFRAGHRPRVSLSTSIGEKYQAPPLSGGRHPVIQLHRDREHASHIALPLAH